MAGASAGGMTSAMAALQSFHEMEHVRPDAPPPAPEKNRLYANWVSRIDLKGLLATSDLDGKETSDGVRSALCCTILEDIVHETFVLSGPAKARAWLGRADDRSLRVVVTLTNLRGVPYSFEIAGSTSVPYAMLNHGDYLDYKIGLAPSATPGSMALDIAKTDTPDWETFRMAALATGAFPAGLAPRTLQKPIADYNVSLRVGRDTSHGFETIAPDKRIGALDTYEFVSVDGGTIDNEPLEIGRRLLAPSGQLDDNGLTARKAIVLIAPFPNFIEVPPFLAGLRLKDVLPQLMSTLVQQSRFKPDELAMALNANFFSRFLISPERDGNGSDAATRYPIASGVLHGFGGFIDESFRRHDFLLGRRNAQAFLRFHLALPEEHALFAGMQDAGKEKWYVRKPVSGEKTRLAAHTTAAADRAGLPIIPLCGGLDQEIVIGEADQPKPAAIDQNGLGDLIRARVAKVIEVLVDNDLIDLTERSLLGPAERFGAKHYLTEILTKKAREMIAQAIGDVAAAFA